jgi:hypothetical protein
MKKRKLKLSDLKITSFVTELNDQQKMTIAGGDQTNSPQQCTVVILKGATLNPACLSAVPACQTAAFELCGPVYSGSCPPPPENTDLC